VFAPSSIPPPVPEIAFTLVPDESALMSKMPLLLMLISELKEILPDDVNVFVNAKVPKVIEVDPE
jgi:hypothetical protein